VTYHLKTQLCSQNVSQFLYTTYLMLSIKDV